MCRSEKCEGSKTGMKVMLGLSEIIDQLPMVSSMPLYGHVPMKENRLVLRKALNLDVFC